MTTGTDSERKTRTLTSRNPATGAVAAEVPILGPPEVAAAVERARSAQPDWGRRSLDERAAVIERLHRLVADRAEAVADVLRSETGKPAGEALGAEVMVACDVLAYLAREAPKVLAPRRARAAPFTHRRARVVYEPHGVIGAITPWNYPFAISMGVVGTALAAGNAVVLKPSEWTPLVGRLVGDLAAEAIGTADLCPVVTGDGSTGAALATAGVDKIAFTGSVTTGRKVMAAAAEHLTPVILELGGKDAMIVCADADVERAARGAVWGAFYGCGQICQSVERLYVVDAVYDDFVKAVVREARRVRTSDEPEAMVGPLIMPRQVDTIERHLEDARGRGARVLLGGRRVEGLEAFFQPTVLVDVTDEMDVMREETFGPVLPILRVADEEEAVRRANGTPFGLDASVWSRDRERARRIADRLIAGTVLINDHLINYAIPDIPFGGVGHSGFGRVHGPEGLREMVRPKAIVEDRLSLNPEPHWFEEGGSGLGFARALMELRHGHAFGHRLRGALGLLRRLRR